MKRTYFALVLVVLAGSSSVQAVETTHIDIKARVFGTGDPWSDSLVVWGFNPVDPVEVEVGVFYYRNTGYGLSTVVHNIVGSPYSAADGDLATVLDRADSTWHPDGRLGNFNYGNQSQVVYHTGSAGVDANRFRIAGSGNAGDVSAGGIMVKQNTPLALGSGFDQTNGVLGYHFKLSFAYYNGGAMRTVVIDAPTSRINTFTVFDTSTSSTSTSIIGSLTPTDPATVYVVWPAPGTLGLLGLAAYYASRRRR